jgi:hypothetical protein
LNPVNGPDAAAAERALRAAGFSAVQAAHLVELRRRAEDGAFREPTPADLLAFARYLAEHGRIGEWPRADHLGDALR